MNLGFVHLNSQEITAKTSFEKSAQTHIFNSQIHTKVHKNALAK